MDMKDMIQDGINLLSIMVMNITKRMKIKNKAT